MIGVACAVRMLVFACPMNVPSARCIAGCWSPTRMPSSSTWLHPGPGPRFAPGGCWLARAGPNGVPRVRQHVTSANGHLGLAREFVAAKIGNQATLLRRHGDAAATVNELRELQNRATRVTSLVELFGIEGDAAARYFGQFQTMLSRAVREDEGISFSGRTRRPARDPVNAALNYCYGLLLADVIRAVVAWGA